MICRDKLGHTEPLRGHQPAASQAGQHVVSEGRWNRSQAEWHVRRRQDIKSVQAVRATMRPTQQNVQGGLYLLLRKARSSLLCLKEFEKNILFYVNLGQPSQRLSVSELVSAYHLFRSANRSSPVCSLYQFISVCRVRTARPWRIAFYRLHGLIERCLTPGMLLIGI